MDWQSMTTLFQHHMWNVLVRSSIIFRIAIENNSFSVNFLDIVLSFARKTYSHYKEPINVPKYVQTHSNHSKKVIA